MYELLTLCISYKHKHHLFSLVGEAAGKAPFGVVKKEDVNVNMTQMRGKVDSVSGVVNDTRMVSSIENDNFVC